MRRGGRIIQEESDRIGYVPVGNAAVTSAGALRARHVIHAVGPRMGEGNEHGKLKQAIRSVLVLAAERMFRSISVPAISAGIFGFPKDQCAKILVSEAVVFLKQRASTLTLIEFCIVDPEAFGFFKEEITVIPEG